MKTLANVDLGASFEKFKTSLIDAIEKTKGDKKDRHAYAFGYLETASKRLLLECTDISGEQLQKEIDTHI